MDWLAKLNRQPGSRSELKARLLKHFGFSQDPDAPPGESGTAVAAETVLLRELWSEIDAWRDNSEDWVGAVIDACEKDARGTFAGCGTALERMQAAGVDPADIGQVARLVAFKAIYHCLHVIEAGAEGNDPQVPGWRLMEIDGQSQLPRRPIVDLHLKLQQLEAAEPAPVRG